MNKKKRVVVAMSGGVDSSLTAALLLEQGYDVIGITLKVWPKELCGIESEKSCCSLRDIEDARKVANWLKIPYYVLKTEHIFKKEVIDYFIDSYRKGYTPNPCIMCNEKVKFDFLLKKAKQLTADFVATGHYARIGYNSKYKRYVIREAVDKTKDQSYVLFSLKQQQLKHILMPLGRYKKTQVRALSKKLKLRTFDKPDSQEICFITDGDKNRFLEKHIGKIKTGDIVDINGKILGPHKGASLYTIGQRKGLGIGGIGPFYVVKIDIENNRVVVGKKEDLLSKKLIATDINWVAKKDIIRPIKVKAKIRYLHKKKTAKVKKISKQGVEVEFARKQSAITPGQAVVFYNKDIVLGGGWIEKQATGCRLQVK